MTEKRRKKVTQKKLKINIIAGTNRKNSRTLVVARSIFPFYRLLNTEMILTDLSELPSSLFSPDVYEKKPPSFQPYLENILNADGLVLVIPEYNGGIPGVFKYFIDMLQFPESFYRRPVSFVGLSAGRWGALRAVEQAQMIFGYRNAHIFPDRVFLPEIEEVIDEEAKALNDDTLIERLKSQALGFIDFITHLRNGK